MTPDVSNERTLGATAGGGYVRDAREVAEAIPHADVSGGNAHARGGRGESGPQGQCFNRRSTKITKDLVWPAAPRWGRGRTMR
jgi:hypothetical protein